ncbi:MAG: hypothetical protein IJB05_08750 [Bacteroidales bacterium]|nr:hypothetical protein [Bacteroidales bacterium]
MRRITILCMALAMSAFAFSSCAYQDWEPEPSKGGSDGNGSGLVIPAVTDFSVYASIAQTKSVVTEEGALAWTAGDLINVFHGVAGEAELVSDGVVFFNPRSEKPNEFLGKLGKELKKGYTYDWYIFYPYNEELSIVNNTGAAIIGSKADKAQIQAVYGDKTHVSGDYMPMFGTATGVEEGKTPNAELQHLSSILELNIASCMPADVQISEVKVTAGEAIVGEFVFDFIKGSVTPVEGTSSNTAALTVKEPATLQNGESAKFYLIVKPFTAKAADGLTISVNGSEKQISLNEDLVFAPGKMTSIDYTYYDVTQIHDSLLGKFRIKTMWVYGGTGAEYGGAGWVDIYNKPWWFDQDSGHSITAELDNYLEFTLTDLLDGGNKLTGKCINWAGEDGKNWSCYFHNTQINGGEPTDGNALYRHIPIGESTWVRDLTVTPNTVTFTDAWGKVTVMEVYEPQYTFVPGYNDSNAAANTRTFPRTDGDDLTFHAKVTAGKDNWSTIYNEIDKVYDRPRDFFVDVDRVDEIPETAKTYEKPYEPASPYPESIAGTYKYNSDVTYGGKDGGITGKGLTVQYATWQPAAEHINKMKNDKYTFTPTGTDAYQNEVGTVTFDDGGDGTWEYQLYDNMNGNKEYNGIELYGIIAHDNTTTYVYDRAARTITFTTRGKEYVVDYLIPGSHKYHGLTSAEATAVVPDNGFGMHYDMGYTEARVEGYGTTSNGFARHYVWARDWVLCLEKQ